MNSSYREACAARNNPGRCSGSSLRTLPETARRNGLLPQDLGQFRVLRGPGSTSEDHLHTLAVGPEQAWAAQDLSCPPKRCQKEKLTGFTEVILAQARNDVNPPFHGFCGFFVDCRQLLSDGANCSGSVGKNVVGEGGNYTSLLQVPAPPRRIAPGLAAIAPSTGIRGRRSFGSLKSRSAPRGQRRPIQGAGSPSSRRVTI